MGKDNKSKNNIKPEKLKTNWGMFKCIIFTILTLGIYSLFAYSKFAKQVNIACAGDGKKTRGLIVSIIFAMLTFGIYPIFWAGNVAERLNSAADKYSVKSSTGVVKIVLLSIFGLNIFAWWCFFRTLNRIAVEYNKAHKFTEKK